MASFAQETRSQGSARIVKAGLMAVAVGCAVYLFKKLRFHGAAAPDEDCPIIIKSGSLRIAMRNASATAVDLSNQSYAIRSADIRRRCTVTAFSIEAGLPLPLPTVFQDVRSFTITLAAPTDPEETSTTEVGVVEFSLQDARLEVKATGDTKFVQHRKEKDSKHGNRKHPKQWRHQEVHGQKDFLVTRLTVNGVTTPVSAAELVIAVEF